MTAPRTVSLDLLNEDLASNPYPDYARLREDAPVHRVQQGSGLEFLLITRHEDARAVLADGRFSKDIRRAERALASAGIPVWDDSGLNTDPPDHTRLRRLVNRAFTPRRVERLRPHVEEITRMLLDVIAPRGRADLIEDVAFPLPVTVICELLGVPVDDQDGFRSWTRDRFAPLKAEGARGRAVQAIQATRRYLQELVARRRPQVRMELPADEQPDMLSALILASDQDRVLDENGVVGMMDSLLVAGHHTTVNLIGNGMQSLFRHPDQLQLLRERPDLLPTAIDELLRYDGPIERGSLRIATEDVDVGGVTVPAGSIVSVVTASAHRDPRSFPDPDRLDVARKDNHHLAFGAGIHLCLGAPLARVEGQVAIGQLLRRFPDIRLASAPEELTWRRTVILGGVTSMRGLDSLPVVFAPQ